MSTLYTINVTNNSISPLNFYFFQKPAAYVGGPKVYSNAIYNGQLNPYSSSGSILTFQFLQQYYAGAQTAVSTPTVGSASGYTTSAQPIDLTPQSSGKTNNCTNLSVNPLGLSPAASADGVMAGAYRIVTPPFNPQTTPINAGLAIKSTAGGTYVLSNFVQALPQENIDCQPVVQFYVAVGGYQAGQVINFSTSSIGSALCDATTGFTTFNVNYEMDGSWTVQPVVATAESVRFAGLTQLIGAPQHLLQGSTILADMEKNVDIRNEAGSASVSTGNTADFNANPIVVSSLSDADKIVVDREYQLKYGDRTVGTMCIANNGNSASFKR